MESPERYINIVVLKFTVYLHASYFHSFSQNWWSKILRSFYGKFVLKSFKDCANIFLMNFVDNTQTLHKIKYTKKGEGKKDSC